VPERRPVVVTAAVIERDDAYLVTRRLKGSHLEGYWEFPGGKCDPGESHAACLAREIDEELGCDVQVGEKVLSVTHDYPERRVELHFFRCALVGDPRPVLGQEIRWATRTELASLDFPPADDELIRLLAN
jgi:8-oxo-dGTP diphosphatase